MRHARPLAAASLLGLAWLAPLAAWALEAMPVERPAPDRLVIKWQGNDPVDVYVAEKPDAPIARARRLAKADREGSYVLTGPEAGRPYFILKDERDGSTARTAERLLTLERGSNFRDVGGYPAADGKHVRWGLIYRTAAMPMLTDADYAYVAKLGIGEVVDLRSSEERRMAPDGFPAHTGAHYFAKDYPASDVFGQLAARPADGKPAGGAVTGLYRTWLISLAPQYRVIFQDLLARKGAVSFHCSAGQDRTGVATALVLSALGVPRDVIFADYHLSTADRRPENEIPPLDPAKVGDNPVAAYYAKAQAAGPLKAHPLYDAAGKPFLQQTFDEIDSRWGSVDAYLDQVLGVDKAAIARLRAYYLE